MLAPSYPQPASLRILFNLNVAYMTITFNRKPAAKQPAHDGHDTGRKLAYAEHRVVVATDRYIGARTLADKENARKWMRAWRSFRTNRH
jgi:hypothetical protein